MTVPTLYEWIGGLPSLNRLTERFYERVRELEWGSRLAVINSQPGAGDVDPNSPMPKWGWGEVKGPYQG